MTQFLYRHFHVDTAGRPLWFEDSSISPQVGDTRVDPETGDVYTVVSITPSKTEFSKTIVVKK